MIGESRSYPWLMEGEWWGSGRDWRIRCSENLRRWGAVANFVRRLATFVRRLANIVRRMANFVRRRVVVANFVRRLVVFANFLRFCR